MNASTTPKIDPTTACFPTISRSVWLALLLTLSSFFSLTASAQQKDAPDTIQTFPVGTLPAGIAFDGANIWVSNFFGATVTKLRGSDGALIGTFPVGRLPGGITFDGVNIWVANYQENGTVTKLRASDGALLGTSKVGGDYPKHLAFDGKNVWVTVTFSDVVDRLGRGNGGIKSSYGVDNNPTGVIFDGTSIWVACNNGSGTVNKISRTQP